LAAEIERELTRPLGLALERVLNRIKDRLSTHTSQRQKLTAQTVYYFIERSKGSPFPFPRSSLPGYYALRDFATPLAYVGVRGGARIVEAQDEGEHT